MANTRPKVGWFNNVTSARLGGTRSQQQPLYPSERPKNGKASNGGQGHTWTEPKTPAPSLTEERLEAQLFKLMTEHSLDGLCRLSLDRKCIYASPSTGDLLGWSSEEMRALFPQSLIHPDDVESEGMQTFWKLETHPRSGSQTTFRLRKKDKSYLWMEVRIQLMCLPATGEPWQLLVNMRDISEQRSTEKKLEALTLTDSLTGLGNRRAFDEGLTREWRRAQREQTALSLLLLDVDNFKRFNDTYGHPAGDDCLRVIATAVAFAARRPGDLAARYGGEEMAIILPTTDAAGAMLIAERLCASIERVHVPSADRASLKFTVTASIGVATCLPADLGGGSMPAMLLESADEALYRAKLDGRNRVREGRCFAHEQTGCVAD